MVNRATILKPRKGEYVIFPESGVSVWFQYDTPAVGGVAGSQCLLSRVLAVSPGATQVLVSYEHSSWLDAGIVYAELRATDVVEDGGVAGWKEEWLWSGSSGNWVQSESHKPLAVRTMVDIRDQPGNSSQTEFHSVHGYDYNAGTAWSAESWSADPNFGGSGAMRRDFQAMAAVPGAQGGSACYSPGMNARQATLAAGGLAKHTLVAFYVSDAGAAEFPDGGWSTGLGVAFGPTPAQVSDECGGSPGCAEGTRQYWYGAGPVEGGGAGSPYSPLRNLGVELPINTA